MDIYTAVMGRIRAAWDEMGKRPRCVAVTTKEHRDIIANTREPEMWLFEVYATPDGWDMWLAGVLLVHQLDKSTNPWQNWN